MFFTEKASAVESPPVKRYRSAFRPQTLPLRSASPPLQYEAFQFKQTSFNAEDDGTVSKVRNTNIETMLIAKDWQHFKNGDQPHRGYISKGLSKYAFRVLFSLLSTYV